MELDALGQSGGKAQPVIDLRNMASLKGSKTGSPFASGSPKFGSPRMSPTFKSAAPMPDMGSPSGISAFEKTLLGSGSSKGRGSGRPYRRGALSMGRGGTNAMGLSAGTMAATTNAMKSIGLGSKTQSPFVSPKDSPWSSTKTRKTGSSGSSPFSTGRTVRSFGVHAFDSGATMGKIDFDTTDAPSREAMFGTKVQAHKQAERANRRQTRARGGRGGRGMTLGRGGRGRGGRTKRTAISVFNSPATECLTQAIQTMVIQGMSKLGPDFIRQGRRLTDIEMGVQALKVQQYVRDAVRTKVPRWNPGDGVLCRVTNMLWKHSKFALPNPKNPNKVRQFKSTKKFPLVGKDGELLKNCYALHPACYDRHKGNPITPPIPPEVDDAREMAGLPPVGQDDWLQENEIIQPMRLPKAPAAAANPRFRRTSGTAGNWGPKKARQTQMAQHAAIDMRSQQVQDVLAAQGVTNLPVQQPMKPTLTPSTSAEPEGWE